MRRLRVSKIVSLWFFSVGYLLALAIHLLGLVEPGMAKRLRKPGSSPSLIGVLQLS
jgi:hypothetical protein